MNKPDILFIHDLILDCLIGVYPEERTSKTTLCINIEVQADLSHAIASDRIEDSVSYEDIYNDVCTLTENSSFQLIEALAQAIAGSCLKYSSVQHVKVSVEKPNIFPKAKSAGVIIERPKRKITTPA